MVYNRGRYWLPQKEWQDYLSRRQSEIENKSQYGEDAQMELLADLYTFVFKIHRHIEKTTNDINLLKILLAVTFWDDISQADIAKIYDIPIGTIGNIIAKYSTERQTKTGNIKNKGKSNETTALFNLIPDKHKTNRKILTLTPNGERKSQEMLRFMNDTLINMKLTDNKSSSVKYDYLSQLTEPVSTLCRYTTGSNDTLNTLKEMTFAKPNKGPK